MKTNQRISQLRDLQTRATHWVQNTQRIDSIKWTEIEMSIQQLLARQRALARATYRQPPTLPDNYPTSALVIHGD